jgi:hypothetical protein
MGKHYINLNGREGQPKTACGLDEATGGVTPHQDEVTCSDCVKYLDERESFTFYPAGCGFDPNGSTHPS